MWIDDTYGNRHGAKAAMVLFVEFWIAFGVALIAFGNYWLVLAYPFARFALFNMAFGYWFRGDLDYIGKRDTTREYKGSIIDGFLHRFNSTVRRVMYAVSFITSIILIIIL